MSKRFTDLWYTTSWSGDVPRDYTKHVPSMMTPERRLLFQAFCLLKTHIVDPTRKTFNMDCVLSTKNKLIVDLARRVLKRSMKLAPATSANGILCKLNQVFGGKSNTAGIDAVADRELEPDELSVSHCINTSCIGPPYPRSSI